MRGAVGFAGIYGFVLFFIWTAYLLVKRNYKIGFQLAGLVLSVAVFFTSVYIMKPQNLESENLQSEVINVIDKSEVISTPADKVPEGTKITVEATVKPASTDKETKKPAEGEAVFVDTSDVQTGAGKELHKLVDGKWCYILGGDNILMTPEVTFGMWGGRQSSTGIALYEEAEWSIKGDIGTISVRQGKYGPECILKPLKYGKGTIIAKYKGVEFYKDFAIVGREYELKPSTRGDGKVIISPQKDKYYEYDIITATAEPNAGWVFSHWIFNSKTDTNNPFKGTANEFQMATAVFGKKINFKDANLEKAVREVIKKPSGDILNSDVDDLTYLDISSRGITNLEGLQDFRLLYRISLSNNSISDLSPLAKCKNLMEIDIQYSNLETLAPLREMTWLNKLHIEGNKIKDVSPLANLRHLKVLYLKDNPIEDYSPLKDIYNQLESKDFQM